MDESRQDAEREAAKEQLAREVPGYRPHLRRQDAEREAVAYVLHEAPPDADLANVADAAIAALDAVRSPLGNAQAADTCAQCGVERRNCRPGGQWYAVCPFGEGGGHVWRRSPQGEDHEAVYCVRCGKVHEPPVAIAINDPCPRIEAQREDPEEDDPLPERPDPFERTMPRPSSQGDTVRSIVEYLHRESEAPVHKAASTRHLIRALAIAVEREFGGSDAERGEG